MKVKGVLFVFITVFMTVLFYGCLTTGDRINMDEFKRQLKEGGAAMDAAQTEDAETYVNAAAEKEAAEPEAVAAAATEEPAEEPSYVPASKPFVLASPEKKAVEAIKAEIQPAKETPVIILTSEEPAPAPASKKNNYKWLLAAVFAAAFALFVLIIFIFTGKKQEKEQAKILPDPGIEPVAEIPEKAVAEYRETASLMTGKPESEPVESLSAESAAAGRQAAPAEDENPDENLPEEVMEKSDIYVETAASVDPVPPLPAAVPLPKKNEMCGEGAAGISPTQFAAGSQGNAVHLLYKNGSDAAEFRNIKITVPEGWSRPSMINTDEGYFTVTVNSGKLTSVNSDNMSMLITVYGLPADTGEVTVVYGERRGGSRGVKVQAQPGEAVFKVETELHGSDELREILDSPGVEVN